MLASGLQASSSLPQLFFARARQLGDQPFLHIATADGWRHFSWRELEALVRRCAAGLATLGVGPGERVYIVGANSLEWIVADIATLSLGGIVVPGYVTTGPAEWLFQVDDCKPRVSLFSQEALRRIGPVWTAISSHARTHTIASLSAEAHERPEGVLPWSAIAQGDLPDLADRVAAVTRDHVACLMYTSGTGGKPRGVQTTHRNIMAAAEGAIANLSDYGLDDQRFLSFLPFSHTYAHTGDLWTPIAIGAQVFLSRGTDHLPGELQSARPTMMNTVPRFWEVMYKRICGALEREPRLKRALFTAAVDYGSRRISGQRMSLREQLMDRITDATVRTKIRARFGGELRCCLCAGAPLNPAVSRFFNALGIRLHEAYGQTECSPGITMHKAGQIFPGTTGVPMLGVEVKLADDGEILVRGDNVTPGYWNDPAATAAVMQDGWLHTGDIGKFDARGQLMITDRKRDFVKTAGGEMIAPQPVEQSLLLEPAIGQTVVCGDAKPYLTALVVPSDELRAEQAAGRLDRDAVEKLISRAVSAANKRLPASHRVRRHMVVDQPFEIDAGLLTPTLKVRRRAVHAAYAEEIETLYELVD